MGVTDEKVGYSVHAYEKARGRAVDFACTSAGADARSISTLFSARTVAEPRAAGPREGLSDERSMAIVFMIASYVGLIALRIVR